MKENNNPFAYISIVAIVAIVAVFVMFAGSGSKETSQPIVLTSNLGGDVVGDARYFPSNPTQNTPTIYVPEVTDCGTIKFVEKHIENIAREKGVNMRKDEIEGVANIIVQKIKEHDKKYDIITRTIDYENEIQIIEDKNLMLLAYEIERELKEIRFGVPINVEQLIELIGEFRCCHEAVKPAYLLEWTPSNLACKLLGCNFG